MLLFLIGFSGHRSVGGPLLASLLMSKFSVGFRQKSILSFHFDFARGLIVRVRDEEEFHRMFRMFRRFPPSPRIVRRRGCGRRRRCRSSAVFYRGSSVALEVILGGAESRRRGFAVGAPVAQPAAAASEPVANASTAAPVFRHVEQIVEEGIPL